MELSVFGTGYLGATHAACLASLGHHVVGVDCDAEKIDVLASGRTPFYEPGLTRLVAENLAAGRLRFTTDVAEAADAEVHFLCVGTPQCEDDTSADLRGLLAATRDLAHHMAPGALLVGRSTVPVGTTGQLRRTVAAASPTRSPVAIAWNPEFLREGQAVADSLRPDRLVLGVDSDAAWETLRRVYRPLIDAGTPVVRTNTATAELAKVSANTLLASRVSLINLIAEVCEAAGADVGDLLDVLTLDERIGKAYLDPGLGYGGGCLPKDCRAFAARAVELGVVEPTRVLDAVDRINLRQRRRAVAMASRLVGGDLAGRRIAVLGSAFKGGSDDIRDSPALAVADALSAEHAKLRVYDPRAGDNTRRARPDLDVVDDAPDACDGADAVVVLTDWDEFAELDPVELCGRVRTPRVLDARRVLDADRWRDAGWTVVVWGEGTRPCGS